MTGRRLPSGLDTGKKIASREERGGEEREGDEV